MKNEVSRPNRVSRTPDGVRLIQARTGSTCVAVDRPAMAPNTIDGNSSAVLTFASSRSR